MHRHTWTRDHPLGTVYCIDCGSYASADDLRVERRYFVGFGLVCGLAAVIVMGIAGFIVHTH